MGESLVQLRVITKRPIELPTVSVRGLSLRYKMAWTGVFIGDIVEKRQ